MARSRRTRDRRQRPDHDRPCHDRLWRGRRRRRTDHHRRGHARSDLRRQRRLSRLGVFDTGGFPAPPRLPASCCRWAHSQSSTATVISYATWNGMQGIVTGTLDAKEAEQLASDLRWNMFPTYGQSWCASHVGWRRRITSHGTQLRSHACACAIRQHRRPFLAPVWANMWVMRLAGEGTGLMGSVSAVATAFSGGTPPQAIRNSGRCSHPDHGRRGGGRRPLGEGQRFDDPNDSAPLCAMRVMTVAKFPMPSRSTRPTALESTSYTCATSSTPTRRPKSPRSGRACSADPIRSPLEAG